MVINTHMIGTLVGLRRVEIGEFVDGKWDNEVPKIELTVMNESLDVDGQKNFSMTKEFLDSKLYSKFQSKQGKVIAIPFKMETKKDKQVFSYDDSMPILTLKDSLSSLVIPDTAEKKS